MSTGEKSMATRASERAIAFVDRMKERILKEMQFGVGFEQVSEKEVTQLIQDSMKGIPRAMMELERLYATNGTQMDIRINAVLAKAVEKV